MVKFDPNADFHIYSHLRQYLMVQVPQTFREMRSLRAARVHTIGEVVYLKSQVPVLSILRKCLSKNANADFYIYRKLRQYFYVGLWQ